MDDLDISNEYADFYAKTSNPTYKFVFKWMTENIKTFHLSETQETSQFVIEPGSLWKAKFSINEFGNYCLLMCRISQSDVTVKYNVLISNSGTALFKVSDSVKMISGKDDFDVLQSFPQKYKDEITNQSDLLFTIVINVELSLITTTQIVGKKKEQLKQLSDDLVKLYDSNIGADLTLRIQGVDIAVHKNILCARSSVFEAMLRVNMIEKEKCVVCIDDVNLSTMKSLLRFLYSGIFVDCDFDSAMKLYYAADKYDIGPLREHCGEILISKLPATISKAAVSMLAVQHSDKSLLEEIKELNV